MKNPPSHLIHDTLDSAFSESERERLLSKTLRAAHGRRQRRRMINGAAGAIILILGAQWIEERPKRSTHSVETLTTETIAPSTSEASGRYLGSTGIRLATDQELLAAIGSRPAIILGDLSDGAVIFLDSPRSSRD